MEMFMKKFCAMLMTLCAAVCLCFGVSMSANAAQIDVKDPYKMAIGVAEQTFSKIKANQSKMGDANFRKALIRSDLLPYVDTRYAGFKVMGTTAKSASAKDRDAFCDAFAEYIVASFADALALYTDQNLVSPKYQKTPASASQVNTKFLIREKGKSDLELIFKLRKNSKTGEWRVFDMVAEGVSMLSAKENELSPLIREKGLSKVVELLNKHNQNASSKPL